MIKIEDHKGENKMEMTKERREELDRQYQAIQDWFKGKIEIRSGFHCVNFEEFYIEKETEKALCISLEIISNDGEYETEQSVWVPKKCFETYAEKEAREQNRQNAFESGCSRYEKLVAFCKENKLKGARVGLRTSTLMAMIEKAGLVYVA